MRSTCQRLVGSVKAKWAQASVPTHGLSGEISEWTLSFRDPNVEKGFLAGRKAQLETAFLWVFAVIALSLAYTWLVTCPQYWNTSPIATPELYRVSRVQLAVQAVMLWGSLATLAASFVLSRLGKIGPYGLELGMVGVMTVLLTHHWITSRFYIARLCGVSDPNELWDTDLGGQDAAVLMWMCFNITLVHGMVPIRWKFLVPFAVMSVLNYVVPNFLYGSPYPRLMSTNITALTGIVSMSCMGKRYSEIKERRLHRTLLTEKRMRFEAEFALSRGKEPQRRPGSTIATVSNAEGSLAGAPSTTPTGKIFEAVVDENEGISLEGVMEIGRKEQWLIDAEEVQLLPDGELGSGGFGVVAKGVYQGVTVAVKSPKTDVQGAVHGVTVMELCNELRILRRLRHPNIVCLYGATLGHNGAIEFNLVMEMIRGSTLREFLRAPSQISDVVRGKLMLHVSWALCYLHSRRPAVVHGDLKADNIFVEREVDDLHRAKLLDFGLSRVITRRARPMGGTRRWMAPEVFAEGRAPHTQADVLSFGRVVFFATTGLLPFHDKRGEALDRAARQAESLTWPSKRDQSSLAQSCKHFVARCVVPEPVLRPDMQEAHHNLEEITSSLLCKSGVDVSVGKASTSSTLATLLEGEEAREASASSSHRQAAPRDDSFSITPRETMAILVFEALWRCFTHTPPESCCPAHAKLTYLDEVRRELGSRPCASFQPLPIAGQCPDCGCLAFDYELSSSNHKELCEVCNGQIIPKHCPLPAECAVESI